MNVSTQRGEEKQLHGVQHIPGLAHNLLSEGPLLTKGYAIVFNHNSCIIFDNQTKSQVNTIQ